MWERCAGMEETESMSGRCTCVEGDRVCEDGAHAWRVEENMQIRCLPQILAGQVLEGDDHYLVEKPFGVECLSKDLEVREQRALPSREVSQTGEIAVQRSRGGD